MYVQKRAGEGGVNLIFDIWTDAKESLPRLEGLMLHDYLFIAIK